jgi:hypothetical protein
VKNIFRYKAHYIHLSIAVGVIGFLLVFYGVTYLYSKSHALYFIEAVIIVILPFFFVFFLLPSLNIWAKSVLIFNESGITYTAGNKSRSIAWHEIKNVTYRSVGFLHLDSHIRISDGGKRHIYISNQLDDYREAWRILNNWVLTQEDSIVVSKSYREKMEN